MGVNLKRIRAYRTYNDLDRQQIADKIGISKSAYANKEQGIADFTSVEIGKMAEIFGVEPGDLFSHDKKLS